MDQVQPLPSATEHSPRQSAPIKLLSGEVREVELAEYLTMDSWPIPPTDQREGYCGDHHFAYWLVGLADAFRVREAAERYGSGFDGPRSLLDIGCSSGRVIRHLSYMAPDADIWACDIDRGNVDWVRAHLNPKIRTFQNAAFPHLQLPDACLDVVTAFSVLTHIDTWEDGWIAEIRRVLKPGGIAYLTFHSEQSWALIPERPHLMEAMKLCQVATPEYMIDEALFNAPMPSDRVVFHRPGPDLLCNLFLTTDYVRRVWGGLLEFCDVHRAASGEWQDVVILRRSD